MLKNMKIRNKLILTFLLITILSSTSSLIGLVTMFTRTDQGPNQQTVQTASSAQTTSSTQTGQTTTQDTQAQLTGQQPPQRQPEYLMIGIVAASFVASVLVAIFVSRDISKPIKEMTKAAQMTAQGVLDANLTYKSKNEIGQLGCALSESNTLMKTYIVDISEKLGKMAQGDLRIDHTIEYKGDFQKLSDSMFLIVESLNDTLREIYDASEQVSNGSEQVSGSAAALAQGAAEQASSIEELSATITDISENVKQNAEKATDASKHADHVSELLESSNRKMEDMLAAMSKINNSSNEIGKIIKTIEDIAFQTNILALNAAVEAARAGTSGKGFAVVADEVRNLAGKSAEAAKNTTELITKSIAEVENGTRIADSTANALHEVVENTKAVADSVDLIAQISNQQANSIGQITLGVEQISRVVQTNSATAEESAAASEELSSQAETMKSLVEKFQLKAHAYSLLEEPAQQREIKLQELNPALSKY